MFRAPSLAAHCVRGAVGQRSLWKTGGPARRIVVRNLADETTAAGSTKAHVVGRHKQQQQQQQQEPHRQRRSVSHSTSRNLGWTSSAGVPEPSGDAQEFDGNEDVSATQRALERKAEIGGQRHGTPEAALTTRIKNMFTKRGNGPWPLAVHLLEKGRQEGIKDVNVYNFVLKMIATDEHITDGRVKEMDRLFTQMKEDGLKPDLRTYSHVIYGHSQAKKEETAARLLEEMVASGLEPDRRTLSSMVVAHSWSSIQDMRRVAAEIQAKGWQPTQRANSAMIGALWRFEDWAGILQVTKSMLENEQTIRGAALGVAIRTASKFGKPEFARQLLELHTETKHRPQEALYVCVMIALRSASQHDECLQCWRELVLLDGLGDIKIDTKTYSLALSSAAKAERWEEVEAIFDMMQAKGVEPALAAWRSMVDVWSTEETGDEKRLDRIFGSMERRGWRPTREVRLHAASAYARSKTWHKAVAWFEPALAEDSSLGPAETEHLVMALGGMKKYAEMKEVWTRSAGSKGKSLLRPGVLVRMAEAARETRDPDWALELHAVSSSGPEITQRLWQDVVRVLTTTGRLETAANVLKQITSRKRVHLETPITLGAIVSAFSELANPAEAAAFVEELIAEGVLEAEVTPHLECASAKLGKRPTAEEDLESGVGLPETAAAAAPPPTASSGEIVSGVAVSQEPA
ncbi:unnamed protein product [Pylaiella littoralis]